MELTKRHVWERFEEESVTSYRGRREKSVGEEEETNELDWEEETIENVKLLMYEKNSR